MVWSLVVVGAVGFLLGLTLRGGALIAATVLTIIFGVTLKSGGGASVADIFLFTLECVVLLQFTYVLGLAVGALWRRSGVG